MLGCDLHGFSGGTVWISNSSSIMSIFWDTRFCDKSVHILTRSKFVASSYFTAEKFYVTWHVGLNQYICCKQVSAFALQIFLKNFFFFKSLEELWAKPQKNAIIPHYECFKVCLKQHIGITSNILLGKQYLKTVKASVGMFFMTLAKEKYLARYQSACL